MINGIRRIIFGLSFSLLVICCTSCEDGAETAPTPTKKETLSISFSVVHPPELSSFLTSQVAKFNKSSEDFESISIELVSEPSLYASDLLASGSLKADAWIAPSNSLIELTNQSVRNLGGKQIDCRNLFGTPLVLAAPQSVADKILTTPLVDITKIFKGSGNISKLEDKPLTLGQVEPFSSPSGYAGLLQLAILAADATPPYEAATLASEKTLSRLSLFQRHAFAYHNSPQELLKKALSTPEDRFKTVLVTEQQMALFNFLQGRREFVALYPEKGTLWLDYSICRNEREWVTPEKQEGIRLFGEFLSGQKSQEEAATNGFRTGTIEAGIIPPLTAEFGVTPELPVEMITDIEPEAIKQLMAKWKEVKRPITLSIIIDTSGSMAEEKLDLVRSQVQSLIEKLSPRDQISLYSVSSTAKLLVGFTTKRQELFQALTRLEAGGGFALYDAMKVAVEAIVQDGSNASRKIIVLIADGDDVDSVLNRTVVTQMLTNISADHDLQLFTVILPGEDDNIRGIETLVRSLHGQIYRGSTQQIYSMFQELALQLQ